MLMEGVRPGCEIYRLGFDWTVPSFAGAWAGGHFPFPFDVVTPSISHFRRDFPGGGALRPKWLTINRFLASSNRHIWAALVISWPTPAELFWTPLGGGDVATYPFTPGQGGGTERNQRSLQLKHKTLAPRTQNVNPKRKRSCLGPFPAKVLATRVWRIILSVVWYELPTMIAPCDGYSFIVFFLQHHKRRRHILCHCV